MQKIHQIKANKKIMVKKYARWIVKETQIKEQLIRSVHVEILKIIEPLLKENRCYLNVEWF
jgi:hypothetical protein